MFDSLSGRLQDILRHLRGEGTVSERVLEPALKEIRLALLEADVNYKVVKDFIRSVRERALGEAVLRSLTPGQQVVGIVRDELVELLGGTEPVRFRFGSRPPTVVLMVGLQGSGKTTTTGKLGLWLRRLGRHPLLVPCDVYRPAATEQLERLGKQVDLPVFSPPGRSEPLEIARAARRRATQMGYDVLLIDSAGRLHIDDAMMQELVSLKQELGPQEILLVADAMTGQDAVKSAAEFDRLLALTGVVLSKLDGDARGGAALSILAVTGKRIRFVGVGEKPDALEEFHAERMAGRILGMGDVLSLVEKAAQAYSDQEARELEEKLRSESFTLEDFRIQLKQLKKLGPLDQILKMVPGMGRLAGSQALTVDDKELVHLEAIIGSMTNQERLDHTLIDGSRRRRIARGSGTSVPQVNQLLKQYAQIRRQMKGVKKLMGRFRARGAR